MASEESRILLFSLAIFDKAKAEKNILFSIA